MLCFNYLTKITTKQVGTKCFWFHGNSNVFYGRSHAQYLTFPDFTWVRVLIPTKSIQRERIIAFIYNSLLYLFLGIALLDVKSIWRVYYKWPQMTYLYEWRNWLIALSIDQYRCPLYLPEAERQVEMHATCMYQLWILYPLHVRYPCYCWLINQLIDCLGRIVMNFTRRMLI